MSGEDNVATLRRIYDLFNSGDLDSLDEFVAPEIVDHNPDPGQAPGLQGVKEMFKEFRAAVPDLRVSAEEIFASGDKVVARGTISGTDLGGLLPDPPPTAKSFSVDLIDIVRFEGGKAVERWGHFNTFSLMQQLGAIPGLAGSPG